MELLLATDPGKHVVGTALFSRESKKTPWKLLHGYAVEANEIVAVNRKHEFLQPEWWRAVAHAVISTLPEMPTFYVTELMTIYVKGSADPADLLTLQGVSGAIAGALPASTKCFGLEPKVWKQQVPRSVMSERIVDKLKKSGEWDLCITKPRLADHVCDITHAIGLGRAVIERRLPDLLFV